ncbi:MULTISPECIES: tyrosine-type recombinase/integrase [unclassified Sphingopyxis]|uniref:tyrosine-type recombinase/integrase n=1 Tax=unclassified Sphingopyxis TaxID=2614943 RepID=UPI000A8872D5|nr:MULTISPECIES: tyrosine-type recombinase/integrase [unclassified Sphingopyxis]
MSELAPLPSSLELVLSAHGRLVDWSKAQPLAIEAAAEAMAPATKAAIVADLKCYLRWCMLQRPIATAVPASPETLVLYLRWLARASDTRTAAKPATLSRRLASIARVHRILGYGDTEALPTQAGMVRDTLKGIRRKVGARQRQAAPLRYGRAMTAVDVAPDGLTIESLIAACGDDLVGLRDAALCSMAYDAGLRVSELVAATVADLRLIADGSGRLTIPRSKTDQDGEGSVVWLSAETMRRLSAWLTSSAIADGAVFRRINILTHHAAEEGETVLTHHIGANGLTRQGVVSILRRRAAAAIADGHAVIEPGQDAVAALSAHSFRVGLTQDLFAAGEDGAGIALALRWSSPTTALGYARELAAGSNAAARVLGKVRS